MVREYHKLYSGELGQEMELLIFGGGPEAESMIVFPTSCGRFFEFEDNGMAQAVQGKLEDGRLRLVCVDSVDAESWYNQELPPHARVRRHEQYERYILNEVVPLAQSEQRGSKVSVAGCSFGGYHAVNISLRHPERFARCVSMSGPFDLNGLGFLNGYYDDNCYFNLPLDYLPGLTDETWLGRLRAGEWTLATGVQDACWNDNERLTAMMREKGLPVRLDVWGEDAGHDWPWWRRMAEAYL